MISVHVEKLIVSRETMPSAIILRPDDPEGDGTWFIPIWTGTAEAASLYLALEEEKLPRPLTHDLMLDALTSLDSYVDHALVTHAKGRVFYAKIALRHHGRLIELDARPSDALSLALKQGAKIFVTEELVDSSSYRYVADEKLTGEEEIEAFRSFVESLTPDDFSESSPS